MNCKRCEKLIKATKPGNCAYINKQFCSDRCELEWEELS